MKIKLLKTAGLVAVSSMLAFSQAALAEINISGWINEGVIFYDDGVGSDVVQSTDNGTTLASRITFAGSTDLDGLEAGFEVIIEPRAVNTPLIFANQDSSFGSGGGAFGDSNGHTLGVLGSSLYVKGAGGKLTVGLQSMPTDNIAVLEDPSLTLWSGISPVFRSNGFTIQNANDNVTPVWGDFLNCFTAPLLRGAGGIGIDCNGIYRQGVRYDLPAFGPVGIAIGWANDDIYDIAAKYKGNMGSVTTQFAIGYAINQGVNVAHYSEAENLQLQLGLAHAQTGLFGSFAYQHEEADLNIAAIGNLADSATAFRIATAADVVADTALAAPLGFAAGDLIVPVGHEAGNASDESDAWWFKVGIKKKWFSAGDTSVAFDYGIYYDQYGLNQAANGVTGSEVQRIGFSIDQYFGSSLIIYGKWEQLELEVDGTSTVAAYGSSEELNTFALGAVYFF
ncbi:hypothetical protein SPBRAN_568 [uncultured Candidatus Thioglobus sp.]|nr:hypothetical protein SPBRAN_568 [uncultured Candidatus Thioglobus sp.]